MNDKFRNINPKLVAGLNIREFKKFIEEIETKQLDVATTQKPSKTENPQNSDDSVQQILGLNLNAEDQVLYEEIKRLKIKN